MYKQQAPTSRSLFFYGDNNCDVGTATGMEEVLTVPLSDYVNVYTIGNRLVRQDVYYKHALLDLPTGVYIVGGQKVFWNNRR